MTARLRLAEGAFSILMLCPACHAYALAMLAEELEEPSARPTTRS